MVEPAIEGAVEILVPAEQASQMYGFTGSAMAPLSHWTQVSMLVTMAAPAAETPAEAFTTRRVPARHAHVELPYVEVLHVGQGVQAVAPAYEANVPFGHGMQICARLNVPGAQIAHPMLVRSKKYALNIKYR